MAATHLTIAFDHVMSGTQIPMGRRQLLFPAWGAAFNTGDPREERRAQGDLGKVHWNWPLFDEWWHHFEESKSWPYMWKRIGVRELGARDPGKMAELLFHTLGMTAFTRRDFEKCADHYRRNGWRLVGVDCPVEDETAREHLPAVSMDDWTTWPPFFPGDRTSIVSG